MRHARKRKSHFDAAQGARQHQVVEVAQVAEPEDFSLQPSKPCPKRHVESLI
jgi:hypothetical protein